MTAVLVPSAMGWFLAFMVFTMTKLLLTLENVSYSLPNGSTLITNVHAQLSDTSVGLVGRNGVGKSVLARILAKQVAPTSGHCHHYGSVYYLPQQLPLTAKTTLAELAGVGPEISALARIEQGSVDPNDFKLLGDRWDIRQELQQIVASAGLAATPAATLARKLSGGQAMRIALAGAMHAKPDLLILDEPSNHLDGEHRQALIQQLQNWKSGLLVISHDRQLLNTLEHIIELSPSGLSHYGGNYAFYSQRKAAEQRVALETLEQSKRQRRREERGMQQHRERIARRQARGKTQRREGSQSKLILDSRQQRSENASGKLQRQHDARRNSLVEIIHSAQKALDNAAVIAVHSTNKGRHSRRVAEFNDIQLPFVSHSTPLNITLTTQHKVGIVGPNGSGKSTLLQVIAGVLKARSGDVYTTKQCAYLDQHLSALDPQRSALAQLREISPGTPEEQQRMRLAQLGLGPDKLLAPCRELSGGEQLKAYLACLLYADSPPNLLLLDEPSNHLDLPSLSALESMLCDYSGCLVVVSHDSYFLSELQLSHRLRLSPPHWQLEPWRD